MKKIYCADLFCGGGGTSTGMIAAFEKRGVDYELVGVNHWDKAIETNRLNHRGRYRRDGVERVSPRELVPGGRLHILWASPECTNHSRAKGGRPKDEQSRATAWDVLKWPQELFIDRIYIENVEEFLEWGPCDEAGHPIAKKKGEIFRQYIRALKAFGYRVDYQVMNAADFGAPTCRRRLIIQAVRGRNQKIRWPEPTHAKAPGLFGEKPWRAAREIIDWNIKGTSIFERKKPLAANTLRRIYSGIAKHGDFRPDFDGRDESRTLHRRTDAAVAQVRQCSGIGGFPAADVDHSKWVLTGRAAGRVVARHGGRESRPLGGQRIADFADRYRRRHASRRG